MNLPSWHIIAILILYGVIDSSARAQNQSSLPPNRSPVPPAKIDLVPRIQFADPVYDFGKVEAGQIIKHDFIFTNTGNAVLEITNLQSSCGCTTMENWDRRVDPGKSGHIPVQLTTTGYRGSVIKIITVKCNDPVQPNVSLQLKGTIWTPIDLLPSILSFSALSELQTNETKRVRIVNNMEEPITLSDVICTNHTFKTALKTVSPGKEFELSVTTVPPFNASIVQAPIALKTTSKRMPILTLYALVVIQSSIVATPSHLLLPAARPLTADLQSSILIRNSATNTIALSEPSLNFSNATVQLKELQPGRLFNLIVKFPAGFQLPAGLIAALSVKTSHPHYPVFSVPISQAQASSIDAVVAAPAAVLNPAANHVNPPIFMNPPVALFTVSKENQTNDSKTVRITIGQSDPLILSTPVCTNQHFKTELKMVQAGKEYELLISTLPPFDLTSIRAQITMKTSSPQMPLLSIPAVIMVQPTILTYPSQIILPMHASMVATQTSVLILNQSTNALVLSEPGINIANAQVRLYTIQPGRLFKLIIDLPSQPQYPTNQTAKVHLTSNHPDYPSIDVPITQPGRVATLPLSPLTQ